MELIDKLKTIKALDEAKIRTTSEEYDRILDVIGSMPIIEKRKKGKWIDNKCSCCGNKALLQRCYSMDGTWLEYSLSNYCPDCGAKMEGDSNE